MIVISVIKSCVYLFQFCTNEITTKNWTVHVSLNQPCQQIHVRIQFMSNFDMHEQLIGQLLSITYSKENSKTFQLLIVSILNKTGHVYHRKFVNLTQVILIFLN